MKQLPDPSLPWTICKVAVALAADKEDLRLASYLCPAGKWTCGWGETEGVGPKMVWTKAYADQRFCDSLGKYSRGVSGMLTSHASDNELGAMTVLAYNIGLSGFHTSTVLRAHNAGNSAAAARAFGLFNEFHSKATGKLEVSHGLTIRRAQEAALYLTPDIDSEDPAPLTPQAVSAEKSVNTSPMNLAGVVTAAGGGIGVLQQFSSTVSDVIEQIRSVADLIGVSPSVAVSAAALAAGVVVIYWRRKQRTGGWA